MRPAAEDPDTAAALSAYQAAAVRLLVGGAIAVVLGVLLGAAVVTQAEGGHRVAGVGLAVVLLVLGGAAGVVAGGGSLLRAIRWRRALAETAWRAGLLRIAGPAVIAFEPEGYDELRAGSDPTSERVLLRLLSTSVWRTRAVQRLDGAQVRAAPVRAAEWVLTADGLPTVIGARRVNRVG